MQPDKKITHDLDYLAQLGYEAFPGAEKDVEELKQKVRARFGTNSSLGTTFIALIVGLFLGITVFFTIYNTPLLFPSQQESIAENTLKTQAKNVALDTVDVSAHVKHTTVFIEKFVEPTESDSVLPIESMSTKAIDLGLNDSVLNADIVYSPNAPIIYLHDLKIANYQTLYFEVKKFVIVQSNVDPDKANRDFAGQGNAYAPNYYLHEAIDDAMKLFKKRKYQACIQALNTIAQKTKDDVNCDFYRGMCYFNLANYTQAYAFLHAAQNHAVNVFKEEATYYKALAAFKLGRDGEARQIMNEIAEAKGFYSKKALEQLTQ
jgi:hypothetical protein